jgi:hypothetical protein
VSAATEEATPEMVEAIAKQLFRVENPPSILWDDTLFVRAGLPTQGYQFATGEDRAAYRERALAHFSNASS